MEEEKRKKDFEKKDNEIVYSKAIKAGRRIYYLDVKKSRNDDLFIAITESKKKVSGTDQNMQVSFEKHKIFLYKEDFQKFVEGLEDVIEFIKKEKGEFFEREELETNAETPSTEIPNPQDEVFEEEGEENDTKKGFFKFFKD